MKNLMLIAAAVLLPLSAVAAQEGRIFYDACYNTDAQGYVDFNRDEITVTNFGDDSLAFSANGTPYVASKVAGFDFFEGGKDIYHFYASKVDGNSFFILSVGMSHSAFTYYSADHRILDENDGQKRCAVEDLHRFVANVKAYEAKVDEADAQKQKQFDSQTVGVTTEWAKGLSSQKSDPALQKGILSWWRGAPDAVVVNPILRVIFIQPSYEITRNELGIVLRKTVDAVLISRTKANGKCFVQWRSFGYEATGGGTFSDEVKDWVKQDRVGFENYPRFIGLPGGRKVQAGEQYEVDCAPFAGKN